MSRRATLLSLAGVLAWVSVASAEGVLDLIPRDAAAALTIRNLNDLKKKGDRFIADGQLKSLPRLSQLFDALLDGQGIRGGVDLDGSMAVMVANPKLLGITLFDDNGKPNFSGDVSGLFVIVLPISDSDAMAANFGIAKGALKPDTLVQGKAKAFGTQFYVRGKYLYFGNDAKVVRAVATRPRAGAELAPGPRRQLLRADVLLHLNREHLAGFWKSMLNDLKKEFLSHASPEDEKALGQLIDTLSVIQTSWITARLDDGLGLSWLNTFPKEGVLEARQYLTRLAGGSGPADLAGLPEGNVIAAQALRGDGARNAAIARVCYASLWDHTFRNLGWLAATDQINHVGVFTEVWKHLKGSRVAVYQNANRAANGLLSVVAILDTEDAEKFLGELRQLAHFGGDDLDLSDRAGRANDRAAVEALIRDLGDDRFPVRESASTKLALIGEAALPQLEMALKSDDAEVRRRAANIKETVVGNAVDRRKELLEKDALRHVHPVFGFQSKPEIIAGQRVDVSRVRLQDRDAKAAAALRDTFGPDWDRIRLVVHDKRVVVLVGSDRDLLTATLANLKEGKRGLADAKVLAGVYGHGNATRRGELHLSLEAAQALWSGADLAQLKPVKARSLTSFALSVDPDLLELDVWIPVSEAKVLEKAGAP
jgi:hypothetical protein